jgi:hypothetical protein
MSPEVRCPPAIEESIEKAADPRIKNRRPPCGSRRVRYAKVFAKRKDATRCKRIARRIVTKQLATRVSALPTRTVGLYVGATRSRPTRSDYVIADSVGQSYADSTDMLSGMPSGR